MAEIVTTQVHAIFVNDDELELIHNVLWSGPRLGHGYYSDLASGLSEAISEVRGEIDYDDRLFDYGDEDGHIWVRTEPVKSS